MIKNLLMVMFLIIPVVLNAQTDKKYMRQGNREYEKKKYSESEISYRKALDKNKQSPDAIFNVGDALYKQKKFEDAGRQFMENANESEDKIKKSSGLYNLGNSLLKADKVQESIDAYKNSLKLNPENEMAKFNLQYAQDLLKLQQQQKQQQKDQDKQDKNQDKNKQNQNNDQKDQNDKNKDQNKDQNKNQEQKQQQQQQPQQQQISKEDAERLLNALANDEKNVQAKVKLEQAAKERVKTLKNW